MSGALYWMEKFSLIDDSKWSFLLERIKIGSSILPGDFTALATGRREMSMNFRKAIWSGRKGSMNE